MTNIVNSHKVEQAPKGIVWGAPRKDAKDLMLEALSEPVPDGYLAHTRETLGNILGKAPNNCVAPLKALEAEGRITTGQVPGDKRIYYQLVKDHG